MSQNISLKWLKSPPMFNNSELVKIVEGYLPVLPIPRVKMRKEQRREIKSVERFILKAIDEVEGVSPQELFEASGVPQSVIKLILEDMIRAAVIGRNQSGSLSVSRSAKNEIFENNGGSVVCHEDVDVGFLLLPLTDDIIALSGNARRGALKSLVGLKPNGQVLVPKGFGDVSVKDYLSDKFFRGEIAGLDSSFLEVVDVYSQDVFPSIAPVYEYKGKIKRDHEGLESFEIEFASRSGPFDLSGAKRLIKKHICFLEGAHLIEKLSHFLNVDKEPSVMQYDTSRFQVKLSAASIAQKFSGKRISDLGVLVETQTSEGRCAYSIVLNGQPEDNTAQVLYGLDEVIGKVLSTEVLSLRTLQEIIAETVEILGIKIDDITPSDVIDRLWKLKEFAVAYQIQEEDVFCYEESN